MQSIIDREDVEFIICDDGSTDGTATYVATHFPKINLIRNEVSKGYLFNRNKLLNTCKGIYAISLDDDANFLSENPLEEIEKHFIENNNCGLIAFRIFWGKELPKSITSDEEIEQVKGFVGCGHAWRIETWKKIPNYPEWFGFFGEESFASFELYKKNFEVHYLPSVLVHHRVDVIARKSNNDYQWRLRRSLRSGWYLFFLYYPLKMIPRKIVYTLWIQIKTKTFKGDLKATIAILQAIGDVFVNLLKILKQRNKLTNQEYNNYLKITETKIFWKPNE
jgi:glycosyltransferase involved in cell wall biosynthesis